MSKEEDDVPTTYTSKSSSHLKGKRGKIEARFRTCHGINNEEFLRISEGIGGKVYEMGRENEKSIRRGKAKEKRGKAT